MTGSQSGAPLSSRERAGGCTVCCCRMASRVRVSRANGAHQTTGRDSRQPVIHVRMGRNEGNWKAGTPGKPLAPYPDGPVAPDWKARIGASGRKSGPARGEAERPTDGPRLRARVERSARSTRRARGRRPGPWRLRRTALAGANRRRPPRRLQGETLVFLRPRIDPAPVGSRILASLQ